MLQSLFISFPQKTLDSFASTLFFVPLAARLVNEESLKCRKMAGIAAKTLLQKMSVDERDACFQLTLCWLSVRDEDDEDEKGERVLAFSWRFNHTSG